MVDRVEVINGLYEALRVIGNSDSERYMAYSAWAIEDAIELLRAQEVVPHRNYKYLSDYWCECGWHLGKAWGINYCPQCGKKVKWDG